MILCFSPSTHGKCNGHWTKNFNGHGTVNSEQWTLATWRRVPASGIMSKPSQKLKPWLCMLWLLSNLLQSWQQGLIFQSKFCLSLSTVAIWHGRKTFTSVSGGHKETCEQWTVNQQTFHCSLSQTIRPIAKVWRATASHQRHCPILVHWNLVKDQVVCVPGWQGGVKHASHLETSPAGSTSWCWRGWGPSSHHSSPHISLHTLHSHSPLCHCGFIFLWWVLAIVSQHLIIFKKRLDAIQDEVYLPMSKDSMHTACRYISKRL